MAVDPKAVVELERLLAAEPPLSQRGLTRALHVAGYAVSRRTVQRILRDTPAMRARRKQRQQPSTRKIRCEECGHEVILVDGQCHICRVRRFAGEGPDESPGLPL